METNMLTQKELQALRHIRNSLVKSGHTPSVRELMSALGYKSPRSAQDILEQLEEKNWIKKREAGDYQLMTSPELGPTHAQTIDVPIVGTITCGTPILADENIEGFIKVSTTLAKPGAKHFLLHASGDSMNKSGINDGDLVLIRQQAVAENGATVVAMIDDEATIKKFRKSKEVLTLEPHSTNPSHRPIILERDFQVLGVAVKVVNQKIKEDKNDQSEF
jgi:repressor LexA